MTGNRVLFEDWMWVCVLGAVLLTRFVTREICPRLKAKTNIIHGAAIKALLNGTFLYRFCSRLLTFSSLPSSLSYYFVRGIVFSFFVALALAGRCCLAQHHQWALPIANKAGGTPSRAFSLCARSPRKKLTDERAPQNKHTTTHSILNYTQFN